MKRDVFLSNIAAIMLMVIGLFQMVGYLFNSKTLRGIGAASVISPFPKVFSDVDGLETFASNFILQVERKSGGLWEQPITPEIYQNLRGPYNRKNVYGAALSYAPRLPDDLWESVFCYGFGSDGPLRSEFGLPDDTIRVRVVIQTKTRGRNGSWILEPTCSR